MSQTYSDVDASADPAEAVAWQERMSRWPAVAAYPAACVWCDLARAWPVGVPLGRPLARGTASQGRRRNLLPGPTVWAATMARPQGA